MGGRMDHVRQKESKAILVPGWLERMPGMRSSKWNFQNSLVVLLAVILGGDASAAPPSFSALFRKKSTAQESTGKLDLSTEDGPWLILARVFDGEDARAKAEALAQEFRTTYRLRAYILAKKSLGQKFDYSETTLGAGFDDQGRQRRMRYAEQVTDDGFAVLVGDFQSADSPTYEESLRVVKMARPKALGLDGSNPGAKLSGTWQEVRRALSSKFDLEKVKPGPMYKAFGTYNPLLPREFYQRPVDEFVIQLNKEVEHSLLSNPGKYTVRVATFRGSDAVLMGSRLSGDPESLEGQTLERAAELAHLATDALRRSGIEAYEFHDRTSSIVAVGAFQEIGSTSPQGTFQYAAEIEKVRGMFGGAKELRGSQYGQVAFAKTLLDVIDTKKLPEFRDSRGKDQTDLLKKYSIPFDLAPTVMAVPKKENKPLYSGSLLGQR